MSTASPRSLTTQLRRPGTRDRAVDPVHRLQPDQQELLQRRFRRVPRVERGPYGRRDSSQLQQAAGGQRGRPGRILEVRRCVRCHQCGRLGDYRRAHRTPWHADCGHGGARSDVHHADTRGSSRLSIVAGSRPAGVTGSRRGAPPALPCWAAWPGVAGTQPRSRVADPREACGRSGPPRRHPSSDSSARNACATSYPSIPGRPRSHSTISGRNSRALSMLSGPSCATSTSCSPSTSTSRRLSAVSLLSSMISTRPASSGGGLDASLGLCGFLNRQRKLDG